MLKAQVILLFRELSAWSSLLGSRYRVGYMLRGETRSRADSLAGTLSASLPPTRPEKIMTATTETITWQRDVDAALNQASRDNKPLLLDFTAAPA